MTYYDNDSTLSGFCLKVVSLPNMQPFHCSHRRLKAAMDAFRLGAKPQISLAFLRLMTLSWKVAKTSLD